jgi:cytoskeletal protein CcmA (bactofilin family)
VGGSTVAQKIETEEDIHTHKLITRDGAKAQRIEIGRRGEVEGPMVAERVLVRERGRVEDVHGGDVVLRRGCRADNVYGSNVTLEDGCRISGVVQYTGDLRLERDVRLASGPEKVDNLPEPPL